jgi:L-ascorbate metabolism protein UlaG (beta-lactamase superfamily)
MCAKPLLPVLGGARLEVKRASAALLQGDPSFEKELQLLWFGSGCHVIQLGEVSVLTDPFVSNGPNFFAMQSDPGKVAVTLGRLAPPNAVLVNHSHFDHILDAHAALTNQDWTSAGVQLYGGQTCANLLAGIDSQFARDRCQVVRGSGKFFNERYRGGFSLEVEAFASRHTPHLKCGTTFADGLVTEARTTPPRQVWDYKAGEVFNYLVTLRSRSKTFRVFYLGALFDLSKMPESIPTSAPPIDVVILAIPGYDKVNPTPHLQRLQPRHVVFSHYNEFFKDAPEQMLSLIGEEGLLEVSRLVQAALLESPRFEAIHVPAITRMSAHKEPEEVLIIR